ncbi:Outer membrane usher protein YraJ [Pseudomonas reidholzensis]|uniref:Outer membrane usher protein YraJ n=1 Tax=Pseudomonas reidholzensis TaxID=1785162 RepID=A0A383RY95_9PSED|nr:fimbria/pilus outer membrane usher protein [Pseudomonas reidholzensis]SYX92039.1 Outer membrane usher protein YraJ [Pseudomonas reidholzensis]
MILSLQRRRARCCLPLLPLSLIVASPLIPTPALAAAQFQAGFLRQDSSQPASAGALALSALASSLELPPGRYRVELQVNLDAVGPREVEFTRDPGTGQLRPCLSAAMLEGFGLRAEALADPTELNTACVDLVRALPGSLVDFDSATLLLTISIPQVAMRRDVAGYVDPQRWDSGINAAFVNYQASSVQGNSRYRGHYASQDLFLNSGLNIGQWRLRSNQSWRQDSEGERTWTRAYSYAQRDLPGTRANLTLGETFTDSDVFRSVPIRGLRVASDLGMLPDSQQGYAPVIRGVAQSRAKLEIWQNGYPIYSTYVSAGPYAIDDLSTAGSGELEVVLTEADGQVRRFIQPYATLGNLLRAGVWRYSVTAGRYNPVGDLPAERLWQATVALGTGWNTTLYGGLMAGAYYRAANLGLARDLGTLGALAVDVTQATSELGLADLASVQGLSYALKYGKAFSTDTTLRFAGYRYSTEGYRDFDEAVRQRSHAATFSGSRRSRLEASIHQNLGQRSSLSLTLSQQDYWQRSDVQRQFQLSLSTHQHGITYNLFASQSLTDTPGSDRLIGLSLSMPLTFGRSANLSYDLQHNRDGPSHRASLNGTTGEQGLSYSASVAQDQSRRQSVALSTGYQGPHANLAIGLSGASDYRSLSLNASGAVLLHADGLEFGPYLGDTAALIEVPGIAGVGVQNSAGVQTNAQGFAMVPYLRPYRVNQVVLQTDRLGPEVDIDNGTAQVVPRRGAIVKTRFSARQVTRLVLTLHTAQGKPLPFGAQVSGADAAPLGVVGQGGQVLLATGQQPQLLDISWGEAADTRCQVAIDPQHMAQAKGYRLQSLTCS